MRSRVLPAAVLALSTLGSTSAWAQDAAAAPADEADASAGEAPEGEAPPDGAEAAADSEAGPDGATDGAAEGEAAPAEAPPAESPPPPEPARAANAPMDDSSRSARLKSLEDLVRRYELENAEFRDEIRSIAERKYKERRRRIEENYRSQLAPVIEAERRYRLDAIAAFERFLERHPDDPEYTPDALFRLAELYFEKYDDEYQQGMKQFKLEYEQWLADGGEGEPPEEPQQHFERTIALYQRLITDFPEYRLLDGAYYLLGYTLRTQGESEEGLKAWQTLVNRYPNSRFYAEVWFRIGDYHFEEEQWPEAIEAFQKVVPMKDSPYYDKGLYKLAWTYYLVNEFDLGVSRFFELLNYSYGKKAEGQLEGGSVLEEESIQYVAISFADDGWPRPNEYKKLLAGDSFEDEFADIEVDYVRWAKDYFAKHDPDAPFKRDVAAKLGDILFKQSKNLQAVAALKWALEVDPEHREAPTLQDLVVQAYERERMFEAASKERDLLVKNYGKGSKWAKNHQGDSEARNKAEDLARISLYKAAIYYHQQANKFFEEEKLDLAVTFFREASGAYKEYLELYPHDKEAYELSFYLAETYYYSTNFDEAVGAYERVRDSTQGKRYKYESALNVVYSLQKVIEAAVAAGKLPEKDPFAKKAEVDAKKAEAESAAEGEGEGGVGEGGAKPATAEVVVELPPAEEIPPLRQQYIGAIDAFLEVGPDHEEAPAFAYQAAALYYSYNQYDEATRRFEQLIAAYPDHEAAKFAGNFILDLLLTQKKWREAAEVAARLQKVTKDDSGKFAEIEGGAKFQIAKETLEGGQKALDEGRISEGLAMLESGADQYLALLEEDPQRKFADLMMYNAALSLEKARRPARAAGLYERLYTEYPESTFAPEAMFRVATKSEQSFNFDKAVDTYLKLVDTYPESERRSDAQINSALALEGQQKYDEAAKAFEKFATLFPDKPEAPEVFYRAALVHKKRGSATAELSTLNRFIKRYRKNQDMVPRVVEAYARIGEIQTKRAAEARGSQKRKLRKAAKKAFESAVDEYDRASGSQVAAYYAGKAAFQLAEAEFDEYSAVKIDADTGKKQGKQLVTKSKNLTSVEAKYKEVITKYKQAEWSLASLYRIGALYDGLQKSLFSAPCPRDIRRIDEIACDEYAGVLEDKAYAVEEKAVEAYRVAYERALELKITNEWTKRTLEALNLLRAAQYPIDKDPLARPPRGEVYSLGLVLPDGGAQELKAVGVGSGSEDSGAGSGAGAAPPPSKKPPAGESPPADGAGGTSAAPEGGGGATPGANAGGDAAGGASAPPAAAAEEDDK